MCDRVENAYEARVAEHRVQVAAIKAKSALVQPEEEEQEASSDEESQESQTVWFHFYQIFLSFCV
jgi:hypothetical protein